MKLFWFKDIATGAPIVKDAETPEEAIKNFLWAHFGKKPKPNQKIEETGYEFMGEFTP